MRLDRPSVQDKEEAGSLDDAYGGELPIKIHREIMKAQPRMFHSFSEGTFLGHWKAIGFGFYGGFEAPELAQSLDRRPHLCFCEWAVSCHLLISIYMIRYRSCRCRESERGARRRSLPSPKIAASPTSPTKQTDALRRGICFRAVSHLCPTSRHSSGRGRYGSARVGWLCTLSLLRD